PNAMRIFVFPPCNAGFSRHLARSLLGNRSARRQPPTRVNGFRDAAPVNFASSSRELACELEWSSSSVVHGGEKLMAIEQIQHPKNSPLTFNVQFSRPWSIVRPRVYRFLESKWIDAFFEDGSLRLSSFRQFAQHEDEQRHDPAEGWGIRAGVGPNMTVFMVGGRGSDAYVLCGTVSNIAA